MVRLFDPKTLYLLSSRKNTSFHRVASLSVCSIINLKLFFLVNFIEERYSSCKNSSNSLSMDILIAFLRILEAEVGELNFGFFFIFRKIILSLY